MHWIHQPSVVYDALSNMFVYTGATSINGEITVQSPHPLTHGNITTYLLIVSLPKKLKNINKQNAIHNHSYKCHLFLLFFN